MSLGYLSCSCAGEVDWCRSQPSWYPYDLDTWEINCVAASSEPGRKRQSDEFASAERNPPGIPVVFVECK